MPLQISRSSPSRFLTHFLRDLILKHIEGTHFFGIVRLLLALRIVQVLIKAIMKHALLWWIEHADHFFANPGIATSDSHKGLIGDAFVFRPSENTLHFHQLYALRLTVVCFYFKNNEHKGIVRLKENIRQKLQWSCKPVLIYCNNQAIFLLKFPLNKQKSIRFHWNKSVIFVCRLLVLLLIRHLFFPKGKFAQDLAHGLFKVINGLCWKFSQAG